MPPRPLRPPLREYHHWTLDTRRWAAYRPRADDIVICNFPKSGTTWTQRIVSLLVFRSPEPRPLHEVSRWIEAPMRGPVEAIVAAMEAQEHRRFIKAHVPFDGLPIYEGVRYLHVARDGRDAFMSWHNHQTGYTPEMLARLDRIGLDDPAIGRPHPRVPADPRAFFRTWVAHTADSPGLDYFGFEASWWEGRRLPNVLLVHYNDLKADLGAEMRRIADFLGIDISGDLWPELVEAAGFEAMKREGDRLLPGFDATFQGGAARFLHEGTNERWRGVLTEDDLALYGDKVRERFTPSLAAWIEGGRRAAGDPRDVAG
jgi:aryl sulfotransferase